MLRGSTIPIQVSKLVIMCCACGKCVKVGIHMFDRVKISNEKRTFEVVENSVGSVQLVENVP